MIYMTYIYISYISYDVDDIYEIKDIYDIYAIYDLFVIYDIYICVVYGHLGHDPRHMFDLNKDHAWLWT